MIDRRRHRRVDVNYCVNLRHPLLGVITASVTNLSVGGLALTLDDDVNCFVMMEFDIEVQGDGWEQETPTLPVQVTRVSGREIAVRFLVENSVSAAERSQPKTDQETATSAEVESDEAKPVQLMAAGY